MRTLAACLGIGDPADFCWPYLVVMTRFHGFYALHHLERAARPAVARLAEEHGLELVVTPTGAGLRLAGK